MLYFICRSVHSPLQPISFTARLCFRLGALSFKGDQALSHSAAGLCLVCEMHSCQSDLQSDYLMSQNPGLSVALRMKCCDVFVLVSERQFIHSILFQNEPELKVKH